MLDKAASVGVLATEMRMSVLCGDDYLWFKVMVAHAEHAHNLGKENLEVYSFSTKHWRQP